MKFSITQCSDGTFALEKRGRRFTASELRELATLIGVRVGDPLRDAIVAHRSQRADDRCIEDDDRLYEALGDGVKCDRRVGSKEEMLRNCERFVKQRCEEGGPWVSYAELQAENAQLRQALQKISLQMVKVTMIVDMVLEKK